MKLTEYLEKLGQDGMLRKKLAGMNNLQLIKYAQDNNIPLPLELKKEALGIKTAEEAPVLANTLLGAGIGALAGGSGRAAEHLYDVKRNKALRALRGKIIRGAISGGAVGSVWGMARATAGNPGIGDSILKSGATKEAQIAGSLLRGAGSVLGKAQKHVPTYTKWLTGVQGAATPAAMQQAGQASQIFGNIRAGAKGMGMIRHAGGGSFMHGLGQALADPRGRAALGAGAGKFLQNARTSGRQIATGNLGQAAKGAGNFSSSVNALMRGTFGKGAYRNYMRQQGMAPGTQLWHLARSGFGASQARGLANKAMKKYVY